MALRDCCSEYSIANTRQSCKEEAEAQAQGRGRRPRRERSPGWRERSPGRRDRCRAPSLWSSARNIESCAARRRDAQRALPLARSARMRHREDRQRDRSGREREHGWGRRDRYGRGTRF